MSGKRWTDSSRRSGKAKEDLDTSNISCFLDLNPLTLHEQKGQSSVRY